MSLISCLTDSKIVSISYKSNLIIEKECLQLHVAFCLWTTLSFAMMTSSNGNIFRVTDPLWRESTSDQWSPIPKASDAEVWCFLWSALEQMVEQTIETPAIWDAIALIVASPFISCIFHAALTFTDRITLVFFKQCILRTFPGGSATVRWFVDAVWVILIITTVPECEVAFLATCVVCCWKSPNDIIIRTSRSR